MTLNSADQSGPPRTRRTVHFDPHELRLLGERAAGALLITIGIVVLGAWLSDLELLRIVAGGRLRMRANLALGLVASGLALGLLARSGSHRTRADVLLPALLAFAIGTYTLIEYALEPPFSIDQMIVIDHSPQPAGGWAEISFYRGAPGRMAPYSAAALATASLALVLLAVGWRRVARWPAGACLLLGSVVLIALTWKVTDRWFPPVPSTTAVSLAVLGFGVALAACAPSPGRPFPRRIHFGIEARVLGAFIAVIVILLVGGRLTYEAGDAFAAASAKLAERQEARIRLSHAYAALNDAESSQLAYLLNGAPYLSDERSRLNAEVRSNLRALHDLVDGVPSEAEHVAELSRLADERLERLDSVALIFEQRGVDDARQALALNDGTVLMEQMRELMGRLDASAARDVARAQASVTRSRRMTLVASMMTLGGSVLILALVFAAIRREMIERTAAQSALVASHGQLESARAAAELANLAKSSFLATMSHEIRTPMNGVVGMVEVLGHTELSVRQADAVRMIRDSAQTLLHLIDEVLDFSKIEAGRLELERIPVRLAELGEAARAALIAAAVDQAVDVAVFVDPRLTEAVLGDPTRLRQILYNLVGNAIKFSAGRSEEHRGTVQLRFEPTSDEATPALRIRVIDNGIGMSREVQQRVFAPFVQGDPSTTRRFGGTGLGLAICERLVGLMGGSIEVKSAPGAGSTFEVVLPLELANSSPPPGERAAFGASRGDAASARHVALTVADARALDELFLVAEDDPINRKVLLNQLALLGYIGEVAANGEEALRLWRTGRYAALLTDLHMPVMDGFALARAVRTEQGPQDRRPIIALSADVLPSTERRALEAGIDMFLAKPVPLERLRQVLQDCLRRPADPAAPAAGPVISRAGDGRRLDPTVLASMIGTDERVVAEFLDAFAASLAKGRMEFVDAWQARDRPRVASLAHRLKSSSRSMGAMALGDSCADLENAVEASGENEISERVQALCSEMQQVGQAVREHLSRSEQSAAE